MLIDAVEVFLFGGWPVSTGLVEPSVVVPVDPFHGRQFQVHASYCEASMVVGGGATKRLETEGAFPLGGWHIQGES